MPRGRPTGSKNMCNVCQIRGCECPSKTEARRALGKKRDTDARMSRGMCMGPSSDGLAGCPFSMKPTETTLHYFHWDHRDPKEKTWHVSQMHLKLDTEYYIEIAKCHLVCLFCHADRTLTGGHLGRPKGSARVKRPVGRPRKLPAESVAQLPE